MSGVRSALAAVASASPLRVFVNGVLDQSVTGTTQAIVYGVPQSRNTYAVIAVDSNGNASTPATIEVDNF